MIKVFVSPVLNSKTAELLNFLDNKDIEYELQQVNTEWVIVNKVKSLPMVEFDGRLYDMKKAMKRLKKG